MLAAVVIGRIVGPVVLDELVESRTLGVMRHDQGADLGAQEMVRAGRAEWRQRLQHVGIHELQHLGRVDKVADLALMLRNATANLGQQTERSSTRVPPPAVPPPSIP